MVTIRIKRVFSLCIFTVVLVFLIKSITDYYQKQSTIENSSVKFNKRLHIVVLTYNRAKSLSRLLKTLNSAYYFSDEIILEVWIDRSTEGYVDKDTLSTAKAFHFEHGEKRVLQHSKHVGLYGQWLSTWTPTLSSTEIAVFLEDDLTVSPYFYKYLALVHQKYDSHPNISGFTLQGTSIKHANGKGILAGPAQANVFLYPVIGTWGFSPCTKKWVQFIKWFHAAYSNSTLEPIVPGNIASSWYIQFKREGKEKGMWSIWHIYYAWLNKEYTLYPNNQRHIGFAANWREAGIHYSNSENKPSNELFMQWTGEFDVLPEEPVKIDLDGTIINE